MEIERKRVFIFLLPFSIFLFLTGVSGLLQLRTEKKEILKLFENQAMLLRTHLLNEAEKEFEYLDMLKNSSSLILPQLFDLGRLDEEIVSDLYDSFFRVDPERIEEIPFRNIAIYERNGKPLNVKGDLFLSNSLLKRLLSAGSYTRVEEDFIFSGFLIRDLIFLIKIEKDELDKLRKKYILKDVIEREGKAINLLGINLYEGETSIFLQGKKDEESIFFRFPFEKRFVKGYTIEIFFSREPLDRLLKKTKGFFLLVFFSLFVLGGFFAYIMVKREKAHEEEIKEMERKMALQERLVALGRLASGVAHEIKNPLNAIGLSIERLKREFVPEEKKEEYLKFLEVIKREVLRLGRIVEDLLSSSRPFLPKKEENLKDLIDEVVIVLKEKAEKKNIQIENLVADELRLECQKERMKQVFFNLIENSIEAIKSDGTIRIEAEKKDRFLHISIKDTGCGIKKEDMDRIFEYYYTTKDKGVGLGLPISYLIVRDHGGEIEVRSEEKKGTTFVIKVPWKD